MTTEPVTLPAAKAAADDLQKAHRELLRVVDSLAPEGWARGVPYGEWTVKELVAHCIGDLSPSGPGLILAGVLTPEFIADTSRGFDVRARNRSMVEERERFTPDDLRQLLFEAHDTRIAATLRLTEKHAEVLAYAVPMGPDYELRVEDWLWYGYHDREHADDIRRAQALDWTPQTLAYLPALEQRISRLVRTHEGFLRAVYSVADEVWGEESRDCPGWTYRDILAHVASNEARRQLRILSAMGRAPETELEATNDVDAWNERAVAERRGRTPGELIEEYQAGWWGLQQTLSQLEDGHLAAKVIISADQRMPVLEFIERMAGHTSRHAGQLVPASRARRV